MYANISSAPSPYGKYFFIVSSFVVSEFAQLCDDSLLTVSSCSWALAVCAPATPLTASIPPRVIDVLIYFPPRFSNAAIHSLASFSASAS